MEMTILKRLVGLMVLGLVGLYVGLVYMGYREYGEFVDRLSMERVYGLGGYVDINGETRSWSTYSNGWKVYESSVVVEKDSYGYDVLVEVRKPKMSIFEFAMVGRSYKVNDYYEAFVVLDKK